MMTDFYSGMYVSLYKSDSLSDVRKDFGLRPVLEMMIDTIFTEC